MSKETRSRAFEAEERSTPFGTLFDDLDEINKPAISIKWY